jgi:hypothetical protein
MRNKIVVTVCLVISFAAGWYAHQTEIPEFILPTSMANTPYTILDAAFCFQCKGVYTRAPINLPDTPWMVKNVDVSYTDRTIEGTCPESGVK